MKKRMQTLAILVAAMASGYMGSLMSQASVSAQAKGKNTTTQVVRARRFELVDKSGKIRGIFGTTKNGDPRLDLYDSAGRKGASFTIKGETKLTLLDSKSN